MDESGLSVRLLGPMAVAVDGRPVDLPGAAERALLALLLMRPKRTVTASSLIDRLWTEDGQPVDPANALQSRVSKLRRALAAAGADVIARDSAGYRADVDPERVDVHRLASLVRTARGPRSAGEGAVPAASSLRLYDEALGLWRGDPLPEFATSSWAAVEIVRLRQLHLAALAERCELALRLGRHVEVADDLQPLVSEDPKDERLAGLLMTALYRAGRQTDALETYHRTRTVLVDELGLEPSAALRSLHQKVLKQDAGLAALPSPAAAPATPDDPPSRGTGIGVPAAVRPLIGRDNDLRSLIDLLGSTRLVSLVGAGGSGKTTLAYAAARELEPQHPDGARVARLAAVPDAKHVPIAVADAVGVPLDGSAPDRSAQDRLIAFLARRQMLLVIDNCEHVVDAVAHLVGAILTACPTVHVLATSREALAVPSEVQVLVGPLDPPPERAAIADFLEFPAVELFVERARAVRELTLDDGTLEAIGRICRQLDGIPLALELAAARTNLLSPAELADRLDDRFALLTGGARTAEARQRTLKATVDWSYGLLSAHEQTLFRRLAVFHGGWTLPAAEAVASDDRLSRADVLDLLGRLVDQSLVIAEAGRETRFRMLETLRQYADELLRASGELEAAASKHAAFYGELADRAEDALRGRRQRETLRRLRDEQPNVRAGFEWLSADASRTDAALNLGGALGLFYHLGRHLEGRDILGRLLDLPGGTPAARARALQAVSIVERPRGCLVHPSPRCAETARQSLDLFDEIGDGHRAALSRVLLAVEGVFGTSTAESDELLTRAEAQFAREHDDWGHAVVAFVRTEGFLKAGDETRALQIGRAAIDAFRALDDRWGLSAVLYHLGWGLRQFGRYAEAVAMLDEAIEVALSAELHNTAQWALADQGIAFLYLGEFHAASACFDRAREASEQIGDGAGEVLSQYGRAMMARLEEDWAGARELFALSAPGFDRLATPVPYGLALAGAARCDEALGRFDAADAGYERGLTIGEAAREPALVAMALEGLSRSAARRGQAGAARALLDRARKVRSESHRPAAPHEAADMTAVADAVAAGLGQSSDSTTPG